ncbi:DUF1905 domain-containing protein [Nocardia sp. NBC_01503]|uniref:DUF1905 domain-containing protein n=1 Tax=Nocardia sp. NBC_01503 TaxID=2975997 RepID=UPI002E7AB3D0|nr:DUF1905 domain-containing protein [Nocardia sp. NBC_01503]WTL30031.1 DUF1905 domain-containing protein [Nocardia sp. NBC_01503]
MSTSRYSFTSELWVWEGPASWYFTSLPEEVADEIEQEHGHLAGGFGSVRVRVAVGGSKWATSLFPDRKRGTYMLPMKKPVRVAEGLDVGDSFQVELEVVGSEST